MSQFGNQFVRKPSAKTIRVAVPAKPSVAPETPPVIPEKPRGMPEAHRIAPEKSRPMPESPRVGAPGLQSTERKGGSYTRVFRWRLPDGQTKEPASVEIIGSFTNWQKAPMTRDSALDSWHITLHNIQGYKTHHYMLLVDGKPAYDKNADGVAPPNGPQEAQFQLMTPRGPRVFLLFAQAK